MTDHATRPSLPVPSRLPGPRAVVGGLLVACAVGITLQVATAADRPPSTSFLVAATDLDVGQALGAGDVQAIAIDLPEPASRHAIAHGDDVTGSIALGPIRSGELLAASTLLRPGTGMRGVVREVSLPVPVERALDGRLVPGELIDLLATSGTGSEASTAVVAHAARVLAVSSPGDSLARAGIVVLTLAVPDDATALAVAHAGATAELSVVRGATP